MKQLLCSQDQLMAGLRAATALDAMLAEEDWLRRYHYTQDWRPGVDLATFSNGGGDDMFILSCADGVIVKGYDHESDVSPYNRDDHAPWPGIHDGAPPGLLRLLDDPAIGKDDITFLYWLPAGQTQWCRGNVQFPNGEDDGSGWLLAFLPVTAQDYIEPAKAYFEEDFDRIELPVIHQHFGR